MAIVSFDPHELLRESVKNGIKAHSETTEAAFEIVPAKVGFKACVFGGKLAVGDTTSFIFRSGAATAKTGAISSAWDRKIGEDMIVGDADEALNIVHTGTNPITGYLHRGYIKN